MPYNLIDTSASGYATISGDPFVDFDAGQVFLGLLSTHYPTLQFTSQIISQRNGNGNRRETLFRITFDSNPASSFFVYCFQTEGGGRATLPNEARIQWRAHSDWAPDLNTVPRAASFQNEILIQPNDLSNKECYVFSFYKRDAADMDIIISAAYPTQAQDVETNSTSNKSIQFSYAKIREAFLNGYSQQQKGNSEFFFHFTPKYLISYMINRDQLHKQALEGVLKPSGAIVRPTDYPYNLIYFGAPGTGKSNAIDSYASDDNSVKITFHPDTDYSSFVGSYKPIQIEGGNDISYGYVAQAFLKAYTKAWESTEDTFLIIEEINRGNCAQIFGDIFQLIERGEDGYSKYKIDVDSEIEKYLKKHYTDLVAAGGTSAATAARYTAYFNGSFKKIALPNNLFIHATMNTSDQSLFPIDSAFKRRWDWEYVPIKFEDTEANNYLVRIGDTNYSWRSFVETVNEKIKAVTESEDKM
ncbi:MAG: AAA family ATPase, partial [Bacteroidota bacterium]